VWLYNVRVKTSDFEYELPEELIAQTPVEPRDSSRLMVLDRAKKLVHHCRFGDILEYLSPGDVLVFNDSRVMPARLYGRRENTGGRAEVLLLRRSGDGLWQALVKPAKRLLKGARIEIQTGSEDKTGPTLLAEVVDTGAGGIRQLRFSDESLLPTAGETPLPPYIHTPLENVERYQTVYATRDGSVAAPTAGLHFTPGLLDRIHQRGVKCCFVTLHVGLDTFRPVTEEDPIEHPVYHEYGIVSQETADELKNAKQQGRRIVCVGTTTARLLEYVFNKTRGNLDAFAGWVDLFILPGYRFGCIDALVTNFHLPRSTLLMLVSAFAGGELIKRAYSTAIEQGYRFYSFGDAMLIL